MGCMDAHSLNTNCIGGHHMQPLKGLTFLSTKDRPEAVFSHKLIRAFLDPASRTEQYSSLHSSFSIHELTFKVKHDTMLVSRKFTPLEMESNSQFYGDAKSKQL